jgi:hypothetical protein
MLKDSKSLKNQRNFVDGKCLGDPDKWFVGHRDAIYSQRYFGERVLQQPRLFAKFVCRVLSDQFKDTGCRPFTCYQQSILAFDERMDLVCASVAEPLERIPDEHRCDFRQTLESQLTLPPSMRPLQLPWDLGTRIVRQVTPFPLSQSITSPEA